MKVMYLENPVVSLSPFIQNIHNFLSPEDCNELIRISRDRLHKSTVLGPKVELYRTSSGVWLQEREAPEILSKINEMIADVTGLPRENQELIHILRYNIGEEYKPHEDFFHPGTDYFSEQIKRGGQRIYSVIIYLNEVEKGGETYFPRVNISVKPETGKVLIWKNVIGNLLNFNSKHAGLPVIAGEKWIAIKWVRELAFK